MLGIVINIAKYEPLETEYDQYSGKVPFLLIIKQITYLDVKKGETVFFDRMKIYTIVEVVIFFHQRMYGALKSHVPEKQ